MKRTAILLGIVLIFLTTIATGYAQTEPTAKEEEFALNPGPSTVIRYFQFAIQKEQQGKTLMSRLDGADSTVYLEMVGLSDTQRKHINDKSLEFMLKMKAGAGEAVRQLNRWQELSPEELTAAEDQFFDSYSEAMDDFDSQIRGTMTPVQLQKTLEYELATPSPFLSDLLKNEEHSMNFAAYDALDLTDEQKKEIDNIKGETNRETEPIFSELKNLATELLSDPTKEPSESVQAKLMTKLTELREKAKTLVKKSQEKVREKLTTEQREKLDSIREEHAKKIAKIKEELEKKAKDDSWKDAWKPGDPLPEGAVPPVKERRFPFRM